MNIDYRALLPAGIHDFTVEELHNVFVAPIQSERREYLYQRLKMFFERLREVGLSYEIWINGSFCSAKPEPGDIDLVVFANPEDIASLPKDKEGILETLMNREETRYRFDCDAYFVDSDNEVLRSYWRGWFGFTRTEEPKGIARFIV